MQNHTLKYEAENMQQEEYIQEENAQPDQIWITHEKVMFFKNSETPVPSQKFFNSSKPPKISIEAFDDPSILLTAIFKKITTFYKGCLCKKTSENSNMDNSQEDSNTDNSPQNTDRKFVKGSFG